MLLDETFKTLFGFSQAGHRGLRESCFFAVIGLFSVLLVATLLFFHLTYIIALFHNALEVQGIVSNLSWPRLIFLTTFGLAISSISALVAWPFALATAVVLEQEKGSWVFVANKFVNWLSSIPVVVYVYIFLQYLAANVLKIFSVLWLESLASVNWITQLFAFTMTLFLYPLILFVPGSKGVTIDQFFNKCLDLIMSFGEMGLTITIVCLGLAFLMLPRMIFEMQVMLKESQGAQSLEVVRSIGGTFWESMHISIIHSMRPGFISILMRFIRFGFFEGVVVFVILKYLMMSGGHGLVTSDGIVTSMFVSENLIMNLVWADVLSLGGWLLLIHLTFVKIEKLSLKKGMK